MLSVYLQQAVILGVLSFFMAWVVQAFFASVLLDIVNAVFICYAMDKDTHSVTNPEVHEVFSQVSSAACMVCLLTNACRTIRSLGVNQQSALHM